MKCEICNKEFNTQRGLSSHISQIHKFTIKEYYDKYLKQPNEGLCVICGKPTKYQKYCYALTCSSKCTCLLKYGVEHNSQIIEVKERMHTKEAHLKSAKHKNYQEITKKRKQTNLERYGNENYNNTKQAQQTNLAKIGKKSYLEIEEIHKLGVDASKSKDVHDRIKQTNLERYNVTNPLLQPWVKALAQTDAVKQQRVQSMINTNMQRYGVAWSAQNKESMQKQAETNIAKYGVKSYLQTKQCREIAKTNIKNIIQKYTKNNYTCRQELLHKYGQGWLSLHIPEVIEKGIAFIQNDYIKIIEEYFYRDKSNRLKPKIEQEIYEYIRSIYKGAVRKNYRRLIYPLEVDYYLPEVNLAIEINGIYWHSIIYKEQMYHFDKSKLCEEKNIRLIHIYEWEWKNNQQYIKNIIYTAIYGQFTFNKLTNDLYEVIFDGTGKYSIIDVNKKIICNYNYGYLSGYKSHYLGPNKIEIDNHIIYDSGYILYYS